MPTGYKPSPLGYGSPRSSPFRRPESPSSQSSSRQITPTPSPNKHNSSNNNAGYFSPSRFVSASSPTPTLESNGESRTPRRLFAPSDNNMASSQQKPLTASANIPSRTPPATTTAHQSIGHGNALSQLQPAQVRVLRDGFQIMDRDSDGVVNREDVMDMLTQLGLPANPSDISQFFPPGGPQTLTLAAFLNSIATVLVALSPASELLSAFSAFDDDDSGQIDVAELRDALLRTVPEPGERAPTPAEVDKIIAGFSGRRAFSKSSVGGQRRGEVFRYQDFVSSVNGSNGSSEANSNANSEE
ncbi:EF-hand [Xylaria bambusicola]|uniref:EF-hand n=1 Tax=Xylaria bambusicola TaxID=326684 RepID=UPI002008ADAB|nr:EF-hand [Xylaria bambusicola]KAI0528060.1 EF-hand [Xylaria bambusicola]